MAKLPLLGDSLAKISPSNFQHRSWCDECPVAALCNLKREVVEVAVTAQPNGFIVWRRGSWEAKGELENAKGQGAMHLQLICSPYQLVSTLQSYLLTL